MAHFSPNLGNQRSQEKKAVSTGIDLWYDQPQRGILWAAITGTSALAASPQTETSTSILIRSQKPIRCPQDLF
jgi:hypothetical protein